MEVEVARIVSKRPKVARNISKKAQGAKKWEDTEYLLVG